MLDLVAHQRIRAKANHGERRSPKNQRFGAHARIPRGRSAPATTACGCLRVFEFSVDRQGHGRELLKSRVGSRIVERICDRRQLGRRSRGGLACRWLGRGWLRNSSVKGERFSVSCLLGCRRLHGRRSCLFRNRRSCNGQSNGRNAQAFRSRRSRRNGNRRDCCCNRRIWRSLDVGVIHQLPIRHSLLISHRLPIHPPRIPLSRPPLAILRQIPRIRILTPRHLEHDPLANLQTIFVRQIEKLNPRTLRSLVGPDRTNGNSNRFRSAVQRKRNAEYRVERQLARG